MRAQKIRIALGAAFATLLICGSVSAQVLKGSKDQAKPVTNDDVVQMVHQGVPESAIVAKIKANPAKFDLSLEKVLAMHRLGVSSRILNEMAIYYFFKHEGGTEKMIPQPSPLRGTLLNSGGHQTLLGTQGTSPSSGANATMLLPAVQRPAGAGGTSAQPAAVERSAATNATLADGSVRTGASGVPTGVSSQAGALNGGPGKTAVTANQAVVTTPMMMPKTSPGQIGASQPMSATGVASPAMRTVAPQAVTAASGPGSTESRTAGEFMPSKVSLEVAAECAKNPTLRILSVSDSNQSATGTRTPMYARGISGTPVIFRPGLRYTISGCSFGSGNDATSGLVILYPPSGGFVYLFWITLDINSWSDNAIVVSFPSDPAYLNELRQSGLGQFTGGFELRVQTAGGVTSTDGFGYSTYPQ